MSNPRYWFHSLSLLSLWCFCWDARLCVAAGAECPCFRNLAKPLPQGNVYSVEILWDFFFFTCCNERVNELNRRGKAEIRNEITSPGEQSIWDLCLD